MFDELTRALVLCWMAIMADKDETPKPSENTQSAHHKSWLRFRCASRFNCSLNKEKNVLT